MRISSFIKQAFKTLVDRDASRFPIGQAKYSGKPTQYARLSVYGIDANAPEGAHVVLISSQGQESVKFGIENDYINRLKNLLSGEVAVHNSVTGSFIIFRKDGSIEAESATHIKLTAPTIFLEGDVVHTGDLEQEGNSVQTGNTTTSGLVTAAELTDGATPYTTHSHEQGDDDAGDVEVDTGPPV